MSQNIASLYEGYCYDATYPKCIGSFVQWLEQTQGWEVLSKDNAGPRSYDQWTAQAPNSGEVVTFTSWTDGTVRIDTGGLVVMTDRQYREVHTRIGWVRNAPEDTGKIRRQVEDLLRKSPQALRDCAAYMAAIGHIKL